VKTVKRRQAAAVDQAHADLQDVWARHGDCLSRLLATDDGSVLTCAVDGPDAGSTAEWENCLARARDTLAAHFR
jgi:hypothetical protein